MQEQGGSKPLKRRKRSRDWVGLGKGLSPSTVAELRQVSELKLINAQRPTAFPVPCDAAFSSSIRSTGFAAPFASTSSALSC